MSESRDHIDILSDEFLLRYRNGTLSAPEQASLALLRKEDPFVADALDGVDASAGDTFTDEVAALRALLRKRTSRSTSWSNYVVRTAAVLLLLLSASYVLYTFVLLPKPNGVAQQEETSVSSQAKIVPLAPVPSQSARASDTAQPSELPDALAMVRPAEPIVMESEADSEDEFIAEMEPTPNVVEQEMLMDVQAAPQAPTVARRVEASQLAKKSKYPLVVAGQVVDEEDGQPLPGVNVLIKNSPTGVVTDIDGRFSMPVSSDSALLTFSAIGYSSYDIAARRINQTVVMSADVQSLSEVVVTGYGTSSRHVPEPVKVAAQPIGGMGSFKKYLRNNARYPSSQPDHEKKVVRVTFVVQSDGQLTDFSVEKSEGHAFDQEAIRLIEEGPRWKAATEGEQNVSDRITVKVRFKP